MTPSNEEILNAVKASGYLFEQEVASIIERSDFVVKTNVAFKDQDEEKSREIDVSGFKRVVYDEVRKITVSVRILVECKNNTHPFVFISRKKNNADAYYTPPNFRFPTTEYNHPYEGKKDTYTIVPAFRHFKLDEIFPFHQSELKAVQFCKIVRKGKDWFAQHDGIYDSLFIPLIKSMEHFKKSDQSSGEWKQYFIYFPIVVVNADLFTIDSHTEPVVNVKASHVSFVRDIHSNSLRGSYLVDFVSKDDLSSFIENHISAFAENFVKKVLV